MAIYIHLHGKNFIPPNTWFDECYGPFNSRKGANRARDLVARIQSNTGQYHNTVKVIETKGTPVHRTLTWAEYMEHAQISAATKAEYLYFLNI